MERIGTGSEKGVRRKNARMRECLAVESEN